MYSLLVPSMFDRLHSRFVVWCALQQVRLCHARDSKAPERRSSKVLGKTCRMFRCVGVSLLLEVHASGSREVWCMAVLHSIKCCQVTAVCDVFLHCIDVNFLSDDGLQLYTAFH